ncbi:transglutaminase-like domain-containing protein [Ramlibacter humi]|uniref:Transglutaminase family protein n=1 Tax=Ramlibacter humi TaxID=2530451 RepID=A0A4Z0BUE6_9BURK|nr:transglutaminase family protein [Ramlibacter humi]TFZ01888.1 transglutaminase family protein [Ramlibacter humi]
MHLSTVETVLAYDVRQPSHFCFNIEAAIWPTQDIVGENLSVFPPVPLRTFEDPGSGNRFFRFDAPPGPLEVRYKADVEVHTEPVDEHLPEVPVSQVPDDILHCLLPTRYCESDVVGAWAREQFGRVPPGIARVRHVVDWVNRNIDYRPGSTGPTSTAHDVLSQRAGVCRDFAHVGITLCRSLNIPARLVAGYVWFDEPPQDFHAVFEAWLDGYWVMFDATGMAPVDRLVRIGTGRDAKDVAFSTIFGNVAMTNKQVHVLEHDARLPVAPPVPPVPAAPAQVL